MRQRYISLLALLLVTVIQMSAQTLNDRYNRQRPVVIVIDNSVSYADDKSAPSGYCEAIAKAVADELGLPCRIATKDKDEAHQALEHGEADIILTDSWNYQDPTCFV
jgi:membrane-bound lytic murein transglycosylase MltF